MKNRYFSKSLNVLSVFLLTAGLIVWGSPPILARDFQVMYDLRVDGNVNTPYGGIGRYENIMTYSEQFDNAVWVKVNTSVGADNQTAPDGTTTADTLTPSINTGYIQNTVSGNANGKILTASVWLKVANGTKTLTLGVLKEGSVSIFSQNITVTTNWQRYSVTGTVGAGTTQYGLFMQSVSDNAAWYAWGAQLEESSQPGVYCKTTASVVTASRGVVSTGDILMPSLKLSGGTITDTTGAVTVGSNLHVTGAGPHYISQGNVGIGATAPALKLDVRGSNDKSATATYENIIQAASTDASNSLALQMGIKTAAIGANRYGGIGVDDGGTARDLILQENSGNVGIAKNKPEAKLDVNGSAMIGYSANAPIIGNPQIEGYRIDTLGSLRLYQNADIFSSQAISFQKDRGGLIVQDDDELGYMDFYGYDGASYKRAAYIISFVDGAPASGKVPGRLSFWTTPIGSGDSIERMRITNGGNVGIGTDTPQNKLDVEGSVAIGATYSGTNIAPSNGLLVEGNVGIGTTGPASKLHLGGHGITNGITFRDAGDVQLFATANGGAVATNKSILVRDGSVNVAGLGFSGEPNTGFWRAGDGSVALSLLGVEKVRVQSGGNVGIGTDTPQNKLDVEGSVAIGAAYSGTNTAPSNGLLVEGNVGIGTTGPEGKLHIHSGTAGVVTPHSFYNDLVVENADDGGISILTPNTSYGGLIFGSPSSNAAGWVKYYGASDMLQFGQAGSDRMFLLSSALQFQQATSLTTTTGDLTIDPSANTLIKGSTSNNTAAALNVQNSASGSLLYVQNDGNVGIGTTAPIRKLEVENGSNTTGNTFYVNRNLAATSTESPVVYMRQQSATDDQATLYIDQAGSGAGLIVNTGNTLLATTAGNVGIGTTAPSAKLHINGNIKAVLNNVSGSNVKYNITGSGEIGYDIAELFDTTHEVEVGDIVVIDEDADDRLTKSTRPYDTSIVGIVSSSPAILFEGSELQIAPTPGTFIKGNKPPVALAGRVLCKVSTENGPIKRGDLLTSSSTPGHAMKATDREKSFGAIVGKALQSFDGPSTGMIRVVVAHH